jgi:DNA mismatch repair protein MutS
VNEVHTDPAQTPLMRQYSAAKQQHPDALLFFRLGDFYELFFEDARTAARELQITLTARDREKSVPMCGVPFHAAEGHIARLLRKGYRVAICEQMEDPKLTKKIVRREVTRVLTPGTAVDASLGAEENNYLAAVVLAPAQAALALLDLSTGEFRAIAFSGAHAAALCADELTRAAPSELLLAAGNPLMVPEAGEEDTWVRALERIRTKTALEDWVFTRDYALPLLERQLGAHSLDGFGVADHPLAAVAAGALLHYAQSTQKRELSHIDSIRFYERADCLQLDQVTVRNLELVEPLFRDGGAESTLFHALDCCQTPMGKRLLRATILRPLLAAGAIACRYAAVGELHRDLIEREELRRALGGVFDLERLLARISLDSAGPRDLLALAASLRALPLVCAVLTRRSAPLWRSLVGRVDAVEDVCSAIETAVQPEPPVTLAEGGVIRSGVHAELDELRAISQTGRTAIAAIEERERTRTGVGSLKVRYTSVFGYYIELTRSNLRHVPADYERKQTLVNAERFTTPELKDYEQKILTAHERSIEIEKQLFAELRSQVLSAGSRIRKTSSAVAEVDLLANFSHLAAQRKYVEPLLDESACVLEIAGGRHPVIEHMMDRAGIERFVPNDLYLDGEMASLLLITGPNMGGKSTYLRQAAMLALMAQMGGFVPADRMRYAPADRIYTRIGASDNVARGRSTFMVEMTETATILNTATDKSLVLLDEMGRGTATYDGLSLAWATLEHLHNQTHARTLFATHYHELTLLAEQLPRLRNLRVSVRETPQGIVFLHTIEAGAASKSYGIEVARLAGLPQRVIARARQVLRLHERAERQATAAELDAPVQLTIFTPLSQRVLDRLDATDVNTLTPLQALNLLEELKNEVKDSRG